MDNYPEHLNDRGGFDFEESAAPFFIVLGVCSLITTIAVILTVMLIA